MAPKMSRIISAIKDSYRKSTSTSHVERLSSSWLLPPTLLFIWRALVSLYCFTVLFFVIGWRCTHEKCEAAQQSFSYFTILGYWGLAFYYAFAAAHTASYQWRGKPWLVNWPTWVRWLHTVFYATITVFPFVVTVVYWSVLADESFATQFKTWMNISQHALNSVFALLEIVLPASNPHSWTHIVPLVVVLACYLGLAYLTHATQGIYVYSFLEPSIGHGMVAAFCVGILAIAVVVFVLARYAIWLRQWITETKLGLSSKLSLRAVKESETLPQWEGTKAPNVTDTELDTNPSIG